MNNVPHWQLLVLIYFLLIAVPVIAMHIFLKKKLLQHKSFLNLLIYFTALIATAVAMHLLSMWLYFSFVFEKK